MRDYISIGRILKPFGTNGWMYILIYSGFINRLDEVKLLYFKGPDGMEGHILTAVDTQSAKVKIRLKGIENKEAAKRFVGKDFFLPESQRIKLPEGSYYIDDLIGMEVFDQYADFRGVLEEVMEMGGNDVYVVRDEEKEILIPAVAEFVKTVDIINKKIVVSLWDDM